MLSIYQISKNFSNIQGAVWQLRTDKQLYEKYLLTLAKATLSDEINPHCILKEVNLAEAFCTIDIRIASISNDHKRAVSS